ncbi:MAG: Crp/Fnr family transcriptional regulator [Leptospiraceae bacterium]|nr:Crp/Fnr family transcriptional regulator [Leptospiraceae bacterium]MCP5513000.1 Crp/Fnr family transcriptional regulator [Leptospiraceae bacterium]
MAAPSFNIVNYQANSYIIVEGKKEAYNFFIIREGKVKVSRENPVVGEDPNQVLGPGDFFGVVAAMSQHPQIESASAMTNVSLIQVSYDQFGTLIQRNTPVAMKIIRYFSMKLRQFDQTITRLSFKNTVSEDLNQLYSMGEFYFNTGKIDHSVYAYQAYLKYLPNGQFSPLAKKKLMSLGQPAEMAEVDETKFNRFYNDNQVIFCEHEPGKELYIIQSGKVKISKIVNQNEVMLAVLENGDIFGEMAILDNKPRSASAVAFGDVTVLAINKANFEGMVKAQPQLATKLITLLSERIWIAYKQLANLMINDPGGRIADTLLTLAEKNRAKIAPKTPYTFQVSVPDVLKMVGLAENRDEKIVYKLFETNKFLRIEGDVIRCADLGLLEKLVQYYQKMTAKETKISSGRR